MRYYQFTSFCLSVLLFCTCNNDDQVTLSMCDDGGTYALDFRPLTFADNYIWLTEADGDLAFSEELPFSSFGLDFLNFPKACEEEYTVSSGSFRLSYGGEREAVQQLVVREMGKVPNGTTLDLQGGPTDIGAISSFLQEEAIYVGGCPPIDSVRFLINRKEESFEGVPSSYEYEYHLEDSVLVIYTYHSVFRATDALLAIRLAEDGSWVGLHFEDFAIPFSNYFFANFEPLTKVPLSVDWPANAQDTELEIRWINSAQNQRSLILAYEEGRRNIEVPLSAEMSTGPILIRAKWTDNQTFETQYVYEEWPEEITVSSIVAGQILSYDYPVLRYDVSGADIVTMNGRYEDPVVFDLVVRNYFGPITTNQEVRLAPLSPDIGSGNSSVGALHTLAFEAGGECHFYHYPAMNGSYSWYIRNILSNLTIGDEWLRALEYERVTIAL